MKYLIFTIVVSFTFVANAISVPYQTGVFNECIKSLKVSRSGWDISYPVITYGDPQASISINFDLIESEMHQITYSLIHCDAEWNPSDLSVNEYMDGFQDNYMNDYDYSRSTNVDYVNYQLYLPNEDVQMRLSGNYAVVFYDQDEDDTIAVACFSVVEPLCAIYGTVSGISGGGHSSYKQQLNFTIDHQNFVISQPLVESKVLVMKNGSRLGAVVENTPTYIHVGRLVYEQHSDMIFSGGGEYRVFETSSLRFAGEGVDYVDYYAPFYHITLRREDKRGVCQYEYDDDINGKYLVRRQESAAEDSRTEADYMVVHFTIPMEEPILDGKVYLGGEFVHDALDDRTQLKYNAESKAYETHLVLKQGYYNYRYYVYSNFTKSLESAPIEMDAYQTENDYQIFFYYRELGERYDRLVGYQVLNTLK